MKKTVFFCLVAACILSASVHAQDAPAPRRMPRIPVSSELVVTPHDPMPASRTIQGLAAIIDGEKLHIGESDLRLFGIVPPQLAASFGPQARAALDTLANGQNVTCQIRDRDRDGRLLATCRNSGGSDMALELLKRGLAVTARGSLGGTDLATPYLAAEQTAQSQKIGLWSVAVGVAPATATAPAAKAETTPVLPVEPPAEKVAPRTDKASPAETQARVQADILSQQAQTRLDDAAWTHSDSVGFFERYQILIAGFLMLITALSIIIALWLQKSRDRSDEIKAIAAALRGELMAARAVCASRVKSIANDSEDRAASWPRIRATLYQAYVGRLGLLGAELARQVASIYGQSSDYAALYNPAPASGAAPHEAPKKQALETLVRNIDSLLPKLEAIEQTGSLRARPAAAAPRRESLSPHPEPVSETPAAPPTESAPTEPVARHESAFPTRTTALLWETVRGLIQNHRAAVVEDAASADPHVTEYAEMIEAEMARYQYPENVKSLDISLKKRG